MHHMNVQTKKRVELIDITAAVRKEVENSRVKDGVCYIYTPHTTTAITINENADPSVVHDINTWLNKLVPFAQGYTHMEGNSDAHIKSSLIGCSETVLIKEGKILLGTWQGIFFCEFDGPRDRTVYMKVTAG